MFLRIEKLPKKTVLGKSIRMSLAENRTAELWQDFMRNKSKIKNSLGTDLYSIQIYDELHYFKNFSPQNQFTKWAAIEVDSTVNIPFGFNTFILETGYYAVFLHKGLTKEFPKVMRYIFNDWLPQSGYRLEDRPHFELLGEKYKNNQPDSEEEIWIPVQKL